MKTSILALASALLLLSACGGGADSNTAASPSAAPTPAPTPDDAKALSVNLKAANIVGTAEPDGTLPVRVLYHVAANVGFRSAYGEAKLPFVNCDGDGTVAIELGSMPAGATVDGAKTMLCSKADATTLTGLSQGFNLEWVPSHIDY